MPCAPDLCKVTLPVGDNGILSFLSHRLPANLGVYYQNPHDLIMGFDGEWTRLKRPYRLDLVDLPTEPIAKQEAKKATREKTRDSMAIEPRMSFFLP